MAKTILVTRPVIAINSLLNESPVVEDWQGCAVLGLPTLALTPWSDVTIETHLIQHIHEYDGVMLVSQHAAMFAFERMRQLGLSWAEHTCLAVVGHASAQQVGQLWPKNTIVQPNIADSQDSEGLWCEMARSQTIRGSRWLIVRAQKGRDALKDRLLQAGAQVDIWACYERTTRHWSVQEQHQFSTALNTGLVIHLSSIEGLEGLLSNVATDSHALLKSQTVVTHHPAIEQAARQHGFADIRRVASTQVRKTLINLALGQTFFYLNDAICRG